MSKARSNETSKAKVVFAPNPPNLNAATISIFLAGSIDMGKAIDWQSSLTTSLAHRPVTILNPRRPNWEWNEGFQGAEFEEQVNWELDGLEKCDIVALFLAKDSKAPISLLELGLCARSGKVVVGCEEGFYRKGNIEIVCRRYGIKMVESLEELKKEVDGMINAKVKEKLAFQKVLKEGV